jgi:hypothetical protein
VAKIGLLACTRHATGMLPLVKDTISVPSQATSNQILACVSHTLPVCTYIGGVTHMRNATDTYLITKNIFANDSPKEHVPPCVVLAINDNPYVLTFVLSYICRTCP